MSPPTPSTTIHMMMSQSHSAELHLQQPLHRHHDHALDDPCDLDHALDDPCDLEHALDRPRNLDHLLDHPGGVLQR